MPKLLDRYIFIEWLKVFAIAIGVTLGILILHDMYGNLGSLINWGASTREILLYYAFLTPTLVPVVLPISLLLSLIYILGSLHRNNEITAMRSAGMNVFRITRSLWLAGVLLAGLLLWLNASLIPHCKEQSRTIYDNAKFEQEMKKMRLSDVGKICASTTERTAGCGLQTLSAAPQAAQTACAFQCLTARVGRCPA